MNPRRIIPAIIGTVFALTLTSCAGGYTHTGTVESKETDKHCKIDKRKGTQTHCTTEYEIDLIQDDGTAYEVKAHTRTDYDRCQIGERFPQCTDGKPQ